MSTGMKGTVAWVFRAPPGPADPSIAFYVVKAADGGGHLGGKENFDYWANYKAWSDAKGAAVCAAFTFLYPTTDGAAAAQQLHQGAPHAPAYVLDVETEVAAKVVTDCVTALRSLAPGVPIGFSSYPTRAQTLEHGSPWDTMIEVCDFGMPQVYFEYQGKRMDTVRADHKGKPLIASFSPGDWPACWDLAREAASVDGAVGLWLYPDIGKFHQEISTLTSLDPHVTHTSTWEPRMQDIDLSHADQSIVTGNGIKPLQLLLTNAGFSTDADGKAGSHTRDALVAFQRQQKLPASGVADVTTFDLLLNR